MKVFQINSVCGIRSTGRICTDLVDILHKRGYLCTVAYGREQVPDEYSGIARRIGSGRGVKGHALAARLFDSSGFHSNSATKRLLADIESYDPDIIHLHNIHGYYVNVEFLFRYLKEARRPVVWTLHDCWAFTGHCSHYEAIGCNKWRTGCWQCPQKGEYPKSIFLDRSKANYLRKKQSFCGVPNLTIVTPSQWLAGEVKRSFLGDYSVKVIQNGIDTDVFRPTLSDFRKRYGLEEKKVILGVATAWSHKKGLGRFFELARLLDDRFRIVLVGLDDAQINRLPDNVIGIKKTNRIQELVEIYTAADVCLSLSVEESMGLTVLEANACGTPAVVLNKTALPELITERNGIVVADSGVERVAAILREIDFAKSFSPDACVDEAQKYSKTLKYAEYIKLYEELLL